MEYGEVLLLNRAKDRILRAYPLPGLPPQQLLATNEAVYCSRTGAGTLPDGMLCRIDRDTSTAQVRVFPAESGAIWLPPSWTITDPPSFTPGELNINSGQLISTLAGETTPIDPETLVPADR